MTQADWKGEVEKILQDHQIPIDLGAEPYIKMGSQMNNIESCITAIQKLTLGIVPEFDPERFNFLGCEKHWSDDTNAPCTCDENKRVVKQGFNACRDTMTEALK